MVQEIESKIKAYLSDETLLYHDWYKGLAQAEDEHTVLYATEEPSLEENKQRFHNYFRENQSIIKQKVCIEWEYSRKRKDYHEVERLIGAIFDFFATAGISTITILVVEGYLDHLCTNC